MNKYSDYKKTLGRAKQIYFELFGKPQTNKEYIDSFNKIHTINTYLIKQ